MKFAGAHLPYFNPAPIPPLLSHSPCAYLEMGEKNPERVARYVCSVLIALVRRRTQTKDKGALIKQKELENRTQTKLTDQNYFHRGAWTILRELPPPPPTETKELALTD